MLPLPFGRVLAAIGFLMLVSIVPDAPAQAEDADAPDEPKLVRVTTVEEAKNLPADTKAVEVLMPRLDDPMILASVWQHARNIETLHLDHPANGLPESAIQWLAKFPKLRDLRITGDANLDEKAFAVLGELEELKSLRLKLP